MNNEEFEDIFGNVPFENIKKIQKYIEDNYVSLDLYEKEKQEKEKFKKALGKRITYCNELEKDLFENCSKYVISKDKIREKIKKYKKMRDCDYNYMSIMYNKLNAIVQALESLIEEE